MLDTLLQSRPWFSDHSIVIDMPSGMLGAGDEAALLFFIARDYYGGLGDVVDAGAFLGASSFCLAKGSARTSAYQANRAAFTLLICSKSGEKPGSTDQAVADMMPDIFGVEAANYESTLGVYMKNLGDYGREVSVHPGDILKQNWTGRPIEILFVDICKTLPIGTCVKVFFPSSIPGVSVVIHQDWHHPWLPYLHVVQELLSDYFELVEPKANDTAMFRLVDRIPERVLDAASAYDYSAEEQMRLIDRAIERFAGKSRFLKLAKAVLYLEHGMRDEASKILHQVALDHGEAMTPDEESYFHGCASGVAERIECENITSPPGFSESDYLEAHPEIAAAVEAGVFRSGLHHWFRHGRWVYAAEQ